MQWSIFYFFLKLAAAEIKAELHEVHGNSGPTLKSTFF